MPAPRADVRPARREAAVESIASPSSSVGRNATHSRGSSYVTPMHGVDEQHDGGGADRQPRAEVQPPAAEAQPDERPDAGAEEQQEDRQADEVPDGAVHRERLLELAPPRETASSVAGCSSRSRRIRGADDRDRAEAAADQHPAPIITAFVRPPRRSCQTVAASATSATQMWTRPNVEPMTSSAPASAASSRRFRFHRGEPRPEHRVDRQQLPGVLPGDEWTVHGLNVTHDREHRRPGGREEQPAQPVRRPRPPSTQIARQRDRRRAAPPRRARRRRAGRRRRASTSAALEPAVGARRACARRTRTRRPSSPAGWRARACRPSRRSTSAEHAVGKLAEVRPERRDLAPPRRRTPRRSRSCGQLNNCCVQRLRRRPPDPHARGHHRRASAARARATLADAAA